VATKQESDFPDRFRDVAVSLRPYGNYELAVPLRVAPDLCADFAASGQAILGGDFWHIRGEHLDLAAHPWGMRSKSKAEPWRRYVDESLCLAQAKLVWASEYFSDVVDPVLVAVTARAEADYPGRAW
jgi:hypothetical protein